MTAQRRLSAILHADLAGFVRLVEHEEDLTFEHLRSARADVCRPTIASAGGSVIHSAGDSLLAEFNSARAAVAAAIEVQERMARFNEGIAEEQRLRFRIGVNIGEIIVDEESHDIFGDGVNLAERIQVMAEPGGIAVSQAVRDVVDLSDGYVYVDGGEHRAKHVSRPIHIYRVQARQNAETLPSQSPMLRGTLRLWGADQSGRRFGVDLPVDRLVKEHQRLVIGRDAGQCDIVLSHSTVSRRHARLAVGSDNKLQIEDMGSTNGTSIDGVPIKPGASHRLDAGAKLKLGEVELTVQYE